MKLACNIDAKGRAVRRVGGSVLLLVGLVLLAVWAVRGDGGGWAWVISGLLIAGGAFCLFEARAGWCALRAMGVKTKV